MGPFARWHVLWMGRLQFNSRMLTSGKEIGIYYRISQNYLNLISYVHQYKVKENELIKIVLIIIL